MTEYRLGSSPAIDAPGMVRWAINGAYFENDRPTMANVIAKGWNLPMDAALALVSRAVPYRVDNDAVVFEFEGAK